MGIIRDTYAGQSLATLHDSDGWMEFIRSMIDLGTYTQDVVAFLDKGLAEGVRLHEGLVVDWMGYDTAAIVPHQTLVVLFDAKGLINGKNMKFSHNGINFEDKIDISYDNPFYIKFERAGALSDFMVNPVNWHPHTYRLTERDKMRLFEDIIHTNEEPVIEIVEVIGYNRDIPLDLGGETFITP